MTEDEIAERIRKMHIAELEAGDKGLWWLSFADEGGFKGVVIVEAYGFTDALHVSRAKRLNPGGEVQGSRVDAMQHPEALRNRLLQKRDLVGFAASSKEDSQPKVAP